jgi:hypothetical protein
VQLVVLDFVSIAAALGVGYYAARMYYHLRQGRLEKGWNMILVGAALIASGYFFLTVEDFFLAQSFFYVSVDYIGTVICSVGLIVLMMGLRSHYSAWSLRHSESPVSKVPKERERDRDKLIDLK